MFTIEYYEKEDGSLPAEDYILSVNCVTTIDKLKII